MVSSLPSARALAPISPDEARLLVSSQRPIVVVKRGEDRLSPLVAPDLDSVGLMLPSTPLHYLLFHELAARPTGTRWLDHPLDVVLVMTSANPGGEPLVIDRRGGPSAAGRHRRRGGHPPARDRGAQRRRGGAGGGGRPHLHPPRARVRARAGAARLRGAAAGGGGRAPEDDDLLRAREGGVRLAARGRPRRRRHLALLRRDLRPPAAHAGARRPWRWRTTSTRTSSPPARRSGSGCARSACSTTTRTSPRWPPSTASRAPRWASPSTGTATGPTAGPGAESCSRSTAPASSGSATSAPCGCREATPRRRRPGAWRPPRSTRSGGASRRSPASAASAPARRCCR